MKELVEYIAKTIVENPDQVSVTEEPEGDLTVLRLQVAESDMGKVIGRQGRVAQAMRTLVRVTAVRKGVRATLEIG